MYEYLIISITGEFIKVKAKDILDAILSSEWSDTSIITITRLNS